MEFHVSRVTGRQHIVIAVTCSLHSQTHFSLYVSQYTCLPPCRESTPPRSPPPMLDPSSTGRGTHASTASIAEREGGDGESCPRCRGFDGSRAHHLRVHQSSRLLRVIWVPDQGGLRAVPSQGCPCLIACHAASPPQGFRTVLWLWQWMPSARLFQP